MLTTTVSPCRAMLTELICTALGQLCDVVAVSVAVPPADELDAALLDVPAAAPGNVALSARAAWVPSTASRPTPNKAAILPRPDNRTAGLAEFRFIGKPLKWGEG
jgi:hypothetical protein